MSLDNNRGILPSELLNCDCVVLSVSLTNADEVLTTSRLLLSYRHTNRVKLLHEPNTLETVTCQTLIWSNNSFDSIKESYRIGIDHYIMSICDYKNHISQNVFFCDGTYADTKRVLDSIDHEQSDIVVHEYLRNNRA